MQQPTNNVSTEEVCGGGASEKAECGCEQLRPCIYCRTTVRLFPEAIKPSV